MTRYLITAILAFVTLALVACGGDGNEVAQPTAAGQSTVAGTPTPMNTPVITDNLFEFKDKGYSVRFPEGWKPLPNFLPGPDFSIDAFFAPEEVEGVQPNMAVTCEELPEGMTLEEYFDAKVEVVKQVTQVEPETSSREVDGQDARQLRFTREHNIAAPMEKTEVVFITERCGWDISLTAPLNDRASYHEPFEQFVDSFRLLP
jgi:hypothetical protein